MISNFVAANGRIVIALLAASTVLAAPTQAKDQPASPAAPNEVLQATHSAEQVIAIPVPLPLPGRLKQFPQRTPPHAAGRSRPFQSRPTLQDRLGAAMEAARVQPERSPQQQLEPDRKPDRAQSGRNHADRGGTEDTEDNRSFHPHG